MLPRTEIGQWSGRYSITHLILAILVFLSLATAGEAATKPATLAEVALYQGPGREQILIDGAKKEGEVMFYNSHSWFVTVGKEFEKKYPFLKVLIWRSDPMEIVKRVTEEFASGRSISDVIETNAAPMAIFQRNGFLQEYYSPEIGAYREELKLKGKTGVYYCAHRETYIGLGFNTKLIPLVEAPRTYNDLLNPKWKGKISLAGESQGVRWIGNALETMGREYLEKLSLQDVKLHNIAPVALAGLITSGEVPLSPTIMDANMTTAKQTGAPVDWIPLEPVVTVVGYSGMSVKTAHPYAALLLLDYLHSKEGQMLLMKGGLQTTRGDVGSLQQKFKKTYIDEKYPLEEYDKKFSNWEELMRKLFMRKK